MHVTGKSRYGCQDFRTPLQRDRPGLSFSLARRAVRPFKHVPCLGYPIGRRSAWELIQAAKLGTISGHEQEQKAHIKPARLCVENRDRYYIVSHTLAGANPPALGALPDPQHDAPTHEGESAFTPATGGEC